MTSCAVQNPDTGGDRHACPPPGLVVASCVYLGLPYVLFFAGWLKWWLAAPAVVATVLACAGAARSLMRLDRGPSGSDRPLRATWPQVLLLVLGVLAFSSVSGMGGYGHQTGDYEKHNAVLHELIEQPWPVMTESDRGRFPLVYYVAWYLPASAVGKAAGWTAANHVLFAWGATGLLLAVWWFGVLAGRLNWVAMGVFALFSGPDVLGEAVMKVLGWDQGPAPLPSVGGPLGLDWFALRWWNWEVLWWAAPAWNYCCNVELVLWVPQQALGGWIASAMAAFAFLRGEDDARRWGLVPAALSALWSPLVTLGLAPFVVADFLAGRRALGGRVRAWASVPNCAALVVLGLMAAYFAARAAPLPFTDDPRAMFRFVACEDWSTAEYAARLALFWLVDVVVVAGLVWAIRPPRGPSSRGLFFTALAVLLVLPLFRYGFFNDLGMRASIPSLFVLAVFVARAALSPAANGARKLILVGTLAIMATTPVDEVYRHLCEMRRRHKWVAVPDESNVATLWQLSSKFRDQATHNDFFFRQYVGSPDSFFFRHLARRGASLRPASERSAALRDSDLGTCPAASPPPKEPTCPRPS